MHPLTQLAREIEEETRGEICKVGKEYEWDNKTVRITSGQYMGEYGVSNSWDWREVLENGELGQRLYRGYTGPRDGVLHTCGHDYRDEGDADWHSVPWYAWGEQQGKTGPSERGYVGWPPKPTDAQKASDLRRDRICGRV